MNRFICDMLCVILFPVFMVIAVTLVLTALIGMIIEEVLE
jgi:hypothetical protein